MDRWTLAQLSPLQPGFWLIISLALLATQTLFYRRLSHSSRRGMQLVRWVLVPYGGLIMGAVSPRLMGLSQIDWRVSLGFGVVLAVLLLLLLLLVRASGNGLRFAPRQSGIEIPRLAQVARGGAEQFYWSFLRGALTELLLQWPAQVSLPGYWASWFAALLAIPDVLDKSYTPAARLIRLTILVITTTVFIYTRNFWLCGLIHIAIWVIFGGRERTAEPPGALDHARQ